MITRGWTAYSLMTLLGLSGCVGNSNSTDEGGPLARQVAQSDHCGLTAPGLVLVGDRSEVDALESLPSRHLALKQLRETDFSREYLVLVGMGQKPTAGYSITLAESAIRDGQLELKVDVREPGQGEMLAQVMTTPCAVVAVTPEGWTTLQVAGDDYPTTSRNHPDGS